MASNHENEKPSEEIEVLKKENAELRKQVTGLQAERDAYLQRVALALSGQMATEEIVLGWIKEVGAEGTLLDFINEAKNER